MCEFDWVPLCLINTNYKIVFQNSDNLATNLREIKQAIRMSWPYDYSV